MIELPGFKAESMVLLVSLWAMRFGEAIWGSFALFSGGFLGSQSKNWAYPGRHHSTRKDR